MAGNARQGQGVRMGGIAILIFVVVLCVAVMAVLCVSFARINTAYTDRQASFTEDVYQNESTAQRFLALMDSRLTTEGAKGLKSQLSAIVQDVQDGSDSTIHAELSDDGMLDAVFEAKSGRQLVVRIMLSDSGYSIIKWKTSTNWKEDDSIRLWQG